MTTLIISGAGKTGARIAARLDALCSPYRYGSRTTDPAFDWNDQSTWRPALEGCSSAYVVYQPDLSMPEAADAVTALAETALSVGVPRLVLLSGRGEPGAQDAEKALMDSGAEWTILRCAFFNQNFSESLWLEPIRAGVLSMVQHRVGEPLIDADDIADVAVAALTGIGHSGQLYELTGPRLLTFEQATSEIGAALGRTITYNEVDAEQFANELMAAGLPPEDAAGLAYLFDDLLDGRNAVVTDGVQRALGREPRDFADYAAATARAGVWNG